MHLRMEPWQTLICFLLDELGGQGTGAYPSATSGGVTRLNKFDKGMILLRVTMGQSCWVDGDGLWLNHVIDHVVG